MVTVVHTCLVLNLPLEMWINVFHTADGNETQGRYVICRLIWTDIRIAPSSRRCTWNTPDLFFYNFSLFLCLVSQGSRHSPASGTSVTKTSTQSRPCLRSVFTLSAGSMACRWKMNAYLFVYLTLIKTKWLAWLFYLPGHLRHRRFGRLCWPVNIKRGWWRSAGN